jgi:hypothetical protein
VGRWLLILRTAALLALAAFVFAACEKPDASHTTSPSARALLGVTEGNVAINPPEAPPAPVSPPAGWASDVGSVRFSTLESGTASVQIVLQIRTQPGPGFEVWLAGSEGTVVRWSGGSARPYQGAVCFQFLLHDGDEGLQFDKSGVYTLTVVWRDPGTGEVITASRHTVTGRPPAAEVSPPSEGSPIFRKLLSCPRSVI